MRSIIVPALTSVLFVGFAGIAAAQQQGGQTPAVPGVDHSQMPGMQDMDHTNMPGMHGNAPPGTTQGTRTPPAARPPARPAPSTPPRSN